MPRMLSAEETKDFIDWLYDEHDIEFSKNSVALDADEVKSLWNTFVDGE